MVLIGHTPVDYDLMNPLIASAISGVRRSGWLGVELFFVLSGLLISGLLFKEIQSTGSVDYWRFWLRRGMKIWPSYFIGYGLMVAAIAASGLMMGDKYFLRRAYQSILPNALFIQNYVDCWRWPHSWSLAIEEHFYTLLPLMLIGLIAIRRLQWLPAAIGSICAIVLALRLVATANGTDWEGIKYPTHFHVDALLFGVLLGYLFAYHPAKLERLRPWWPIVLAASIGVILTPRFVMLKDHPYVYATIFTAFYLVFGSLVLIARLNPDWGTRGPKWFRSITAGLAWIGVYSYTIYIMHGVISKLPYIKDMPDWFDHPALAPCLFLISSIAGGVLLSHVVERPFLRLRDRWIPAASKAQPKPKVLVISEPTQNSSASDRRAA